jgi:carboxylesterase
MHQTASCPFFLFEMTSMLPFQPFTAPEHQPFTMPGGDAAALLVHGFPGTPLEMRATAQILHELGYTVKGILMPGFGTEIETLPTRKAGDWLQAILNALAELRREHSALLLVGNSMGSALSLAAAAQIPPDKLILFSPFWRIPGILWPALPIIKKILPQVKPLKIIKPDYQNPQFRQGLAEFLPGIDFDDPQIRASVEDFAIPIGLFDEIRQAGEMGYKAIVQQKAPALIMQGLKDDLVRPALTRQLVKRFPVPVNYLEFPQGGHNLYDHNEESWPQVEQAIRKFVA